MQAANNFVQVKIEDKKGTFVDSSSTLLEGKVVSCGNKITEITKGQKVLFPSQHGKAMLHSLKGEQFWFIDESIILAYE